METDADSHWQKRKQRRIPNVDCRGFSGSKWKVTEKLRDANKTRHWVPEGWFTDVQVDVNLLVLWLPRLSHYVQLSQQQHHFSTRQFNQWPHYNKPHKTPVAITAESQRGWTRLSDFLTSCPVLTAPTTLPRAHVQVMTSVCCLSRLALASPPPPKRCRPEQGTV